MSGWRRAKCANTECAEVKRVFRRSAGTDEGMVLVRSSQTPYKIAEMTDGEWAALVAGIKAGDFDDLG